MQLQLPKDTQHSRQAFINKLRSGQYIQRPSSRSAMVAGIKYPGNNDLHYRMAIEAQGPLMTYNEDGQFSAPDLTAWYAQQFVKENHLVA